MIMKQVPNLITLARLILSVLAFVYMSEAISSEPAFRSLNAFFAFWFFFIAAITDWLDGFLARRYGWVSAFGRIADPVVDKVLILGSMAYLSASHPSLSYYGREGDWHVVMPVWAVVLCLGREFLVTALRGIVESEGKKFPADVFGKAKMFSQALYIGIALGTFGGIPEALGMPFLDNLRNPTFFFSVFWLMISLTALSGVNYCLRGAQLLKSS